MADVSYDSVMDVTLSWDRLKSTPNYQDAAGEFIFLRLFELVPSAKQTFKFKEGEDVRSNPLFSKHARSMVDMIDCAVGFLGPDLDPLTEDLMELGQRHIQYGVQEDFLPHMGTALKYALEKVLVSKIDKNELESWTAVLGFIISKMTLGMQKKA